MPVTILNTGTFNGGGTSAPAGLAAGSGAALNATVTTGVPGQPAAGHVLFGAYPGGNNTDPNASYNGGTWEGSTMSNRLIGCYYRYWQLSDCPTHPTSDDTTLVTAGRTLVVSLTTSFTIPPAGGGITYANVTSGTYDTDLTDLATGLAALPLPSIVVYGHEFDISQNSGYGTAAQFITSFQHVTTVMRAAAPGMVSFAWTCSGTAGTAAYYPGDAYTDWLGVDPYDPTLAKGSPSATYTPYVTWLNGDPLAVSGGAGSGGGHGKPLGIFETGVEPTYDTGTGAGTEAYWLGQVPACLSSLTTTWGSQYQVWQWYNDSGTWNTKITPGGNAAGALATIGANPVFN